MKRLALIVSLFALVATPAAAMTTAEYVAQPGKARVKAMAYHAHGNPYACDFDHNGRYGEKQVHCVVYVVFWHDGARAIANAWRTSGGESGHHCDGPAAINHNTNGSTDYGLFQINSIHGQSARKMLRCVPNTLFARKLWISVHRRWSPTWVAATKLGIR